MFAWYVLFREAILFLSVFGGLLFAEVLLREDGLKEGIQDGLHHLKRSDYRHAVAIALIVTFIQFLVYVIIP